MAEAIHQGRNIKRFREMRGLKQEALAYELGEDWTQKKVSLLESKEVVEEGVLDQVAGILKIPKEAIENLTEEGAVNIVANTFQDFKDNAVATANHCSFNPMDKYVEAVEKIEKLYEQLLKVEREKIELMQRMLDEKR